MKQVCDNSKIRQIMTIENVLMFPMAGVMAEQMSLFETSQPQPSQPQPILRTRNHSGGSTGSYGSSGSYGSASSHGTAMSYGSSSTAERQASQNQHKSVNPTRYKTELCRPYEESGYCKYGEKCQFAHGGPEMRSLSRHPKYKTELCRTYHTVGFCPYGPRCHFIHNEDELRLTEINHMKHQQVLKQVAQQVAQQQQVLSQLALQQQQQQQQQQLVSPKQLPCGGQLQLQPCVTRPRTLDFSSLSLPVSLLGSTIDSPPASVTDSSPSLSPTSMLGDDVFTRVSTPTGVTTPPPGFSALPTSTPPAFMFNYPSVLRAPKPTVPTTPQALNVHIDPVASLAAELQSVFLGQPSGPRQVRGATRDNTRWWSNSQMTTPLCTPPLSVDSSHESLCESPMDISKGLRLPIFSHFVMPQAAN